MGHEDTKTRRAATPGGGALAWLGPLFAALCLCGSCSFVFPSQSLTTDTAPYDLCRMNWQAANYLQALINPRLNTVAFAQDCFGDKDLRGLVIEVKRPPDEQPDHQETRPEHEHALAGVQADGRHGELFAGTAAAGADGIWGAHAGAPDRRCPAPPASLETGVCAGRPVRTVARVTGKRADRSDEQR